MGTRQVNCSVFELCFYFLSLFCMQEQSELRGEYSPSILNDTRVMRVNCITFHIFIFGVFFLSHTRIHSELPGAAVAIAFFQTWTATIHQLYYLCSD